MSAHEHENGAPAESRSSVKISLNAKREVQVEVKVYAGDDAEVIASARELAVENFYETLRACGERRA